MRLRNKEVFPSRNLGNGHEFIFSGLAEVVMYDLDKGKLEKIDKNIAKVLESVEHLIERSKFVVLGLKTQKLLKAIFTNKTLS